MSSDEGNKWCYAKEYRVRDVEEAVELAENFRQKGAYNWFRGQAKPWPPHTSLYRAQQMGEAQVDQAKAQLSRLDGFMKLNPELKKIAADYNAFFAVAQHYGIPTNYLDFTTEPVIAGFFACDTGNPEVGSDSCIYCLNTDDIVEAWDALTSIRSQAKIELVTAPVPNLWRLESQHGVFLYCIPANWDGWYEMDKIIFPYRGYPAYPPKDVIYPNEKSSLENLLDHFFVEETRRAGREEILKVVTVRLRADAPPDFYSPKYFKDGQLEPHPSWDQAILKTWEDANTESFQTIQRQPIT
jgi:hypothetical protein